MKITIKKVSTSEYNVSKRYISYDLYINGVYHSSYEDILMAMDAKAILLNY